MNQGSRGTAPALVSNYQARPTQPDTQRVFLSSTNYARILQPLREQYEKKLNRPELPDDIDRRLQKTLQHYMNEVYRINGPNTPVNTLNQEAFRETSINTDAWLQRQAATPVIQTKSAITDPIFDSVGSRFEREQQTRAPPPAQPMGSVNFSFPQESEEEAEDPLDKYERIRKIREAETKAAASLGIASNGSTNSKPKNDILSEPSAPAPTTTLPAYQSNNPPPPPQLAPRPQDYIIKQEDIVKYKENEWNLYIYSGDRDWLNNRNENRFNFTVSFNPANNTNMATYSPSVKERFRNIVRMELVKVIMSSESLNVSVRQTGSGTDTARVINVLNYPYLMVRINEWTGNGYGTSANIDNTFGLIQYDQTWKSDSAAGNFGYISMTPRYLKAQRVYSPTPLATLQKLSLTLEKPDGTPLASTLDTLDLSYIYLSSSTTDSLYSTPPNDSYIFIVTKTYFNRFAVSEGDTIQIRGYDVGTDLNVYSRIQLDFNSFVNSADGHIVVGTGNTEAIPSVHDTPNSVGYCNVIIIRSRFDDPTTGSTGRNYFGGTSETETLVKAKLQGNQPSTNTAILNRNRQSHFTLRIITREMDYGSNIRPDNT